jgi:hypothetical protein
MDASLNALAEMLKRTQHRRVIEGAPPTPPAVAHASLPPFQIPGLNNSPVGTPPFLPPQSPAANSAMPPPAMPPTQTASVPPAIAPGDQTVPPGVQPVTDMGMINGPGAGSGPNTPGFWERINKAMAAQQIPDGYRGAMGEMIKNG